MKFEYFLPVPSLQPYIKYFVIAEQNETTEYKIFPDTALVAGFQYRGQLSRLEEESEKTLSTTGITGLTNQVQSFKNSGETGSVLVYFRDTGLAHFTRVPLHEIYDLSIDLTHILDKNIIRAAEDSLHEASTDEERIAIVEKALLAMIEEKTSDVLILKAVEMINEQKGNLRIRDLQKQLFISQSPFEKRFRRIVGTSPKKYASIVRFQHVLEDMKTKKSLAAITYEHNFFDPAHFSREFKQFTGQSPEQFIRE